MDRRAGRLPEVSIGQGGGEVQVGVGIVLPRNPVFKRYSAMEVGEVGIKQQPHRVEAQRHAETL